MKMKYCKQVPVPGSEPYRLPWPMTGWEAARFMAVMIGFTITSFMVVLLGSFELIGPSLWRFVPAVLWVVVLRKFVNPFIASTMIPKDLKEREAAFERQQPEDQLGR